MLSMKIKEMSTTIKLAGAIALFAVSVGCAIVESTAGVTAFAAENKNLQSNDFSVLLPDSYEQYLPLSNVTDVAVSEEKIAVANENDLYVYDGKTYKTFSRGTPVYAVEFTAEGELLMLDADGVFRIDYTSSVPSATEVFQQQMSNFAPAASGGIYSTSSSKNSCSVSLIEESGKETALFSLATSTVPSLFADQGTLYCAYGNDLYVYNSVGGTEYADVLPENVIDITVSQGIIYCVNQEGLYAVTSADYSTKLLARTREGCSFGEITQNGAFLYITQRFTDYSVISQFDLNENCFTDYQIGTKSEADNRLMQGSAIAVSESKLFFGDVNRIVSYDKKTKKYSAFPTSFTPDYIAADNTRILVCNGRRYEIYSYDGLLLSEKNCMVSDDITGVVTDFNGNFYLSFSTSSFAKIVGKELLLTEIGNLRLDSGANIQTIASDPFGRIYVLDVQGNVFRYSVEELENRTVLSAYKRFNGTDGILAADFHGTAYLFLSEKILTSDGTSYGVNPQSAVFGSTQAPVGYALDPYDGKTYFLYEHYVLYTDAVQTASLVNLPAGDSYDKINRTLQPEQLTEITVAKDTSCISFSVNDLEKGDLFFEGCSFERLNEQCTANVICKIKISEYDYYVAVPVLLNKIVLVPAENCSDEKTITLSAVSYLEKDVGYITNQIGLYKYPYITSAFSYLTLSKGSAVNIKNIYHTDNGDFLVVEAQGQTGFVPANYVQSISGSTSVDYSTVRFTEITLTEDLTVYTNDRKKTITLLAGETYRFGVYDAKEGDKAIVCYTDRDGVMYYATIATDLTYANNNRAVKTFFGIILLIADLLLVVNIVYKRRTGEQ